MPRLTAVALAVVGLIVLGILETAEVVRDGADDTPTAIVPFACIAILVPAAVGLAIAIHQPHRTSQITLRISFISYHYP